MQNLIGCRFGRLTVIKELERNKNGRRQYICKCDCGKEKKVVDYYLTQGNTRSCGCLAKEKLIETQRKNTGKRKNGDLTGKRFGRLLVIGKAIGNGNLHNWNCLCDCGNKCVADEYHLTLGLRVSCGCLPKEIGKENLDSQVFENTRPIQLHDRASTRNTSGVRGVSFKKDIGKWYAYISLQGERHFLGYFDKLEDAAKARENAEEKIWGPLKQRYEKVILDNAKT